MQGTWRRQALSEGGLLPASRSGECVLQAMSTGRTDVAGRTTTARARLAPQATSDYDELMEGFREVLQYVDSTLQRAR